MTIDDLWSLIHYSRALTQHRNKTLQERARHALSLVVYNINNTTRFSNILLQALLNLLRSARARGMRCPHRTPTAHGALGYGPTPLHDWKLIFKNHGFIIIKRWFQQHIPIKTFQEIYRFSMPFRHRFGSLLAPTFNTCLHWFLDTFPNANFGNFWATLVPKRFPKSSPCERVFGHLASGRPLRTLLERLRVTS